jgi:hypothetical protein
MLDLYEEFAALIDALETAGVVKVDMSPEAVSTRLKRVSQLRRLCLALGKATPVTPMSSTPTAKREAAAARSGK